MASTQGKVRIIGGEWRSRIITFPDRTDLRPTSSRIRETVFNWLGQDLSGKVCLDLFAGSGAMGLEAASRGAKQVIMVESDPSVLQALRKSVDELKATQVELTMVNALAFLASCRQKFDIVFLDPPYQLELLPKLLSLLHSNLVADGLVYVENDSFFSPDEHWKAWRSKRAGKVYYQLLKMTSEDG